VSHYYDKERPNQLRGRPVTSNSVVTAKTYDSYTDAELVRKESRSALTGTIERESYTDLDYKFDPMSGEALEYDHQDTPMINLEAGTFQALLAGEKLKMIDADDTGVGYRDYQVFQLMQIAASHGIPYQLLTGDWQGINDRVWRAIFNQYKREVQQDQELGIMPQVCTQMYHAFIRRGIVAGVFDVSSFKTKFEYLRVNHKTQAFEYIHPEQDINAETKRLKAGLTSRSAIISRRGFHGETIETIDAERAEDKSREDGLDLKSTANYDVLGDDMPEPIAPQPIAPQPKKA
jgi:lambda family phage portal protein